MLLNEKWQDYECLVTGNGEKVERFKDIILRRPDPQIIWNKLDNNVWNSYDGYYHRSVHGGGCWEFKHKLPKDWIITYDDLKFKISPTNFKHVGLFPEQGANWDYIRNKLNNSAKKDLKVLNLFAYTGGATVASASSPNVNEVVHVDASKNINEWAKENIKINNLNHKTVRFIQDDVLKFLDKEKRRNHKYDAIILDPPSYGRGPNKEVWKLEDSLKILLDKIKDILNDNYEFILINCYTTGFSHLSLYNLLKLNFKNSDIETGEIALPVSENNLVLPCGIYGRITR